MKVKTLLRALIIIPFVPLLLASAIVLFVSLILLDILVFGFTGEWENYAINYFENEVFNFIGI